MLESSVVLHTPHPFALNESIHYAIVYIFFVILPQQREMQKLIILKSKKRKGLIIMMNEVIKQYIGKNCKISIGSFNGSFNTNTVGKIIDVNEN